MKRILSLGGTTLAVLGVVFVVFRLRNYIADISFSQFKLSFWLSIFGFSFIYGVSNLCLAVSWRNILSQFDVNVSLRWSIKTFGISQIAKYVPGNIFHLAGRQVIGMADGISGWALAKSSIWELALISSMGSVFGILVIPLLFVGLSEALSAVIFLCIFVMLMFLLYKLLGIRAAVALFSYSIFLAISGFLFVGLVGLLAESRSPETLILFPIIGSYVLAWLVGLVTPGAPAGVGVRELVLLFLLKNQIDESDLLVAIILGRLVTVVGDILYFFAASLMRREGSLNDGHAEV